MTGAALLVVGYAAAVPAITSLVRSRPAQPLRSVAAMEIGAALVAAGWWLVGWRVPASLNAGFGTGYLVCWLLAGGSGGRGRARR